MASEDQPLDPVWAAWSVAIGSFAATWLITLDWKAAGTRQGGGFEQFALFLVGPIIYGIVCAVVGYTLMFVLRRIAQPAIGIGIIVAFFAVMAASRGTPAIWEVLLAAFMGLGSYYDSYRRAPDAHWRR